MDRVAAVTVTPQPNRPGPRPLPIRRECDDCGGRLSTTPGVIQTIRHTEDCWKHVNNRCTDCGRNHYVPEDCVLHGRRFDPDAHALVQTAQLALEYAVKVRQQPVNAHLVWADLEAHLGVLVDDLPHALTRSALHPGGRLPDR